jgi:8-oxo-dGTP pyrophosphatase MutT (NUDIX family)
MNEYELSGIETIARGVCVKDGRLLLCRAKGGKSTYLPGGHIEFGETGRAALVREVREELGVESSTGAFLGVLENSFMQNGKPHAEINLVYELNLSADADADSLRSCEDWIEFVWHDIKDLSSANLLPEGFRALAGWPDVRFEC